MGHKASSIQMIVNDIVVDGILQMARERGAEGRDNMI